MSRPAARPQPRRTVECPTCGASRFRPCTRVKEEGLMEAGLDHGWTVSPHAARKRLEQALRSS